MGSGGHEGPKWAATRVAQLLGVRYPIVQGPFGGGLSTPELAATVSNAGGLGSFGANLLAPEEIEELVPAIGRLTDRPFAVNLWVSTHDEQESWMTQARFDAQLARLDPFYAELGVQRPVFPERFGESFEAQVRALLEARPPVFSFVFGIPSAEIVAECRERGIVTIGTATTADEALALDAAGVDVIVVSGFEAGGHRASFLESAEASLSGTLALVPIVAGQVRAPVIAAGGIADDRGIVAAVALGAEGVQIGTAFLACDESGAPPAHRRLLHSTEARHTALTRAFTGRLARGVRNRLVDEMPADAIAPYPFQGWFLKHLREPAIAAERTDLLSVWSGQAAPLLRHTRAEELMRALVEGTGSRLQQLAALTP